MLEGSHYDFHKAADVLNVGDKVRDVARSKSLDLRTAAFALGIQRVGRASLARQALREDIPLE